MSISFNEEEEEQDREEGLGGGGAVGNAALSCSVRGFTATAEGTVNQGPTERGQALETATGAHCWLFGPGQVALQEIIPIS